MIHFGVDLLKSKYEFNISREQYAIIDNKSSIRSGKIYSDKWCEKHLKDCLINFDLNMKYFKSLDKNEFDNSLNNFLEKNKDFIEVFDLNTYAYKSGYYILVLDKFCQIYVGTSQNIKRRIMAHWSKKIRFDRLIFGSVTNSIISIDSFRALDTTRIFAYTTDKIFNEENNFIDKIPSKFLLNRTDGGKLNGGLTEAIVNGKTRNINNLK